MSSLFEKHGILAVLEPDTKMPQATSFLGHTCVTRACPRRDTPPGGPAGKDELESTTRFREIGAGNAYICDMSENTQEEPVTLPPKTRKCLRCREAFESEWAGERICPRCKSSQAWKSGTDRVFG